MNSRRTFIKQSALLGAAVVIGQAACASAAKSRKTGLQLYTLRDQIGKDVPGVIKKVAAAGYQNVEPYGYTRAEKFWGMDPKSFKSLLSDNGLISTSAHYGMDPYFMTGDDSGLKSYIEAANILGQDYVTVPWLDPSVRKTADDWKRVADKINKAADVCKASGLKLAYHNHDFEFEKLDDGSIGYDVLLKNTNLKFEMDLYWVVRAKHDPLQLFAAHPGRFVMWHVKDMSKANPADNTEVGNGAIDFKPIFAAAKTSGLENFFVEQETNYMPEPFGSIAKSAAFVKTLV